MKKTFTRSRKDRVFSGVCGGLAELSGIPSWLVRLIAVLLALSGDLFIAVLIAYVVLSIVIPEESAPSVEYTVDGQPGQAEVPQDGPRQTGSLWAMAGIGLVVWGAILLIREVFHISLTQYVLPVLLVVAGAAIIFWAAKKPRS
jgi:phage shock protein C